jgi:hypothetical protein
LNNASTNGSVDNPTKLSNLKFPNGAFLSYFTGTILYGPARLSAFKVPRFGGEQKQNLYFHIGWHPSPSLLVTVYCFKGCPEELGHLFLRLFQFLAEVKKFSAVHSRPQESFG